MKRIVLFLSFLCLLAPKAQSSEDDSHPIPIQVLDHDVEDGKTHRSSSGIPISAFYDDFSSLVCLEFQQNIGETSILIMNTKTGENVMRVVNSAVGYTTLQISGDPGVYYILIQPLNGVEYEGEFRI